MNSHGLGNYLGSESRVTESEAELNGSPAAARSRRLAVGAGPGSGHTGQDSSEPNLNFKLPVNLNFIVTTA